MDVMDYIPKLPERAAEPVREIARLLMEDLRKHQDEGHYTKRIKVEQGPVLRIPRDISLGIGIYTTFYGTVDLRAEFDDKTDNVSSGHRMVQGTQDNVRRWIEEDHTEELAVELEYLYWNTHTWD